MRHSRFLLLALGLCILLSLPSCNLPTISRDPATPTGLLATPTVIATSSATPQPTGTSTIQPSATPQPKATLTPQPIQPWSAGMVGYAALDGAPLVYIPAGDFLMGSNLKSDPQAFPDELDQHTVTLAAFWINQLEISNGQFARCVATGACQPPQKVSVRTRPDYYKLKDFAFFPVVNITWEQARAFCDWAGGRLPTEAEWEKAARGDQAFIYPWGNDQTSSERGNFERDETHILPPGSFPAGASPYGVLDMAGNVWEWVADWYAEDGYDNQPVTNPTGPKIGTEKVLRGGASGSNARVVRAANRFHRPPDEISESVGFRCVTTAQPLRLLPTPMPAVVEIPTTMAVMPAPLYFIENTHTHQVWQLSVDGKTLRQVTYEGVPVDGLDVSPVGGTMAYIANNALYLADAGGNSRRELVKGQGIADDDYTTPRLRMPRWSPDGKTLAYGLGGLNLFDLATGENRLLIMDEPSDGGPGVMLYAPLRWSPDGQKLMVWNGYYEGCGLLIYDLPTQKITELPFLGVCYQAAWSPDSQAVYLASDTSAMWETGLWRAEAESGAVTTLLSGVEEGIYRFPGWPVANPEGGLNLFYAERAVGGSSPALSMSTAFGVLQGVAQLRSDRQIIWEALWSPDASLAVVASEEAGLQLLRADNSPAIKLSDMLAINLRWGQVVEGYTPPLSTPVPLVSPTPPAVALPGLAVITAQNARQVAEQAEIDTSYGGYTWSLAVSPDGRTLAFGSEDATIRLWDVSTGAARLTLVCGQQISSCRDALAFSPDGRLLASQWMGENSAVRLWDTAVGQPVRDLTGLQVNATSLAFSADGSLLAVGGWGTLDTSLSVWDINQGKLLMSLTGQDEAVLAVAFSPDGRRLASTSLNGSVFLWDLSKGEPEATYKLHSNAGRAVAFSPDGKLLVSGGQDNAVYLWEFSRGVKPRLLEGYPRTVSSLAFSPDGSVLAVAEDFTIHLWDTTTWTEIAALIGHTANIQNLAFSADGRLMVSAAFDNTIIIWGVSP